MSNRMGCYGIAVLMLLCNTHMTISRPTSDSSPHSCLTCPRGCECSYQRLHPSPWVVNCSDAGHKEFPIDVAYGTETLDLSYNDLSAIAYPPPLPPLERLSWLSLQNTGIRNLTWNFLCDFPNLKHVVLHDNKDMDIAKEDDNVTSCHLEHITIDAEVLGNLQYLPNTTENLEIYAEENFDSWNDIWKVLTFVPDLRKLSIRGLSLGIVPVKLLFTLQSLQFLSLQDCNISNLNDFLSTKSQIHRNFLHLDISHNNIQSIPYDVFQIFANVLNFTLDLSHNDISKIDNSSFHSIKSFHSIYLNQNNLGIENFERLLTAVSHAQLYELNVAKCKIDAKVMSKNMLAPLGNTGIKRFDISENRFILLAPDNYFYLSKADYVASETFVYYEAGWAWPWDFNWKEVHLFDMAGDSGWQILTRPNVYETITMEILKIYGWNSALRPNKVYSFPNKFYLRDLELRSVDCGRGLDFSNLSFLNSLMLVDSDCTPHKTILKDNNFIRKFHFSESTGNSDLVDMVELWFTKSKSVEVLHLSDNMMKFPQNHRTFAAFASLGRLEELYFSGNGLKHIGSLFRSLYRLQTLDLSHNKIDNLPIDMLLESTNLKELHLQGNVIVNIDPDLFLPMADLLYLDIRENRFQCGCQLRKFSFWMREAEMKSYNSESCAGETMVYISGKHDNCSIGNGNVTSDLTLIDYNISWLYCDNNLLMVSLLIATFSLMFFATTSVFIYRQRTSLLILWRRISYTLCRPPHKEFKFDCYVSYCDKDFEFIDILQKDLECESSDGIIREVSFRMCIKDRDFLPGEAIIDNIVNNMDSSRVVLFVLTGASLKDVWCQFEAEYGIWSLIINQKRELIVIYLQTLGESNMCVSLKNIVRHAQVINGTAKNIQEILLDIKGALCKNERAQCLKMCSTC